MSVFYILSDLFDYRRMICDDAGPGYAKRQGWQTVPLSSAHSVANQPHIFDNRLTIDELPILAKHIAAIPRHPVFIKVVDPQLEAITQPFYQEILALASKANVQLVGPYQETGITALASRLAGRPIYHFLPYAYDPDRERPIGPQGNARRKSRLFLCGALSPHAYPDRWRIYETWRKTFSGRRLIKYLKHSGYPDIGANSHHSISGDSFIQFASRYAGMWVDPRAEGLELLKFCECAYAGCAPFGVPAPTTPQAAAKEVWTLPAGQEVKALRKGLSRDASELSASALRYREAMRAERNSNIWNERFIGWWKTAQANL